MVAKFGIFLRYVAPHDEMSEHKVHASLIIGLMMVVLGTVICLGSAIQFRRFITTLSEKEVPPRWFPSFAGVIALAMAVGGLGLAVYLVM